MLLNKFAVTQVNNYAVDTLFSIAFIVLTVVSVIALIWLLVRYINVKNFPGRATVALTALIAAGVLVRIALSFVSAGNRQEVYALYEAAKEWSKYGPGQYISRYYFQTGKFVYPLQYYYAGITAGSLLSAGVEESSVLLQLAFKLPLIVADAFTAVIVYNAAKKYQNEYTGVILAGFVMLCPVFIFASAVWTSVYSVFTALLTGSFYAIVNKKYPLSLILYGIALLLVRDASYLFPLYAVYFIYIWVKQAKILAGEDGDVKQAKFNLWALPLTVAGVIVAQYVVCLPLTLEKYSGNFFSYFEQIFIYPLKELEFYSNNSLSLYNIFGRGGWATDVVFRDQRAIFFIGAFALIIAAVTAIVYFYAKNRAILTFVAAYSLFLLHTSYFDFTITSLLPSLVLFMLSFVFIKDKRLLKIMLGESLLVMFMMLFVYISGGYLNNLPLSVFTSPDYIGNMQITATTWGTVAAITLSVLSIANFAYATIVMIQLSMSEKRVTLGGNEKAQIWSSLKYFLKK